MKKLDFKKDTDTARAAGYPSAGAQLDAIYKGFVALKAQGYELPAETEEWLEVCSKVKADHPKGE